MARINKANNDGSISIIIPKSIRKINNWVPGQNVDIIAVNPACILLKNTDSVHQFSKIEDIWTKGNIPNKGLTKGYWTNKKNKFKKLFKCSKCFYNPDSFFPFKSLRQKLIILLLFSHLQ